MSVFLKRVIPAIRNVKDFEKAVMSDHEHIILLETRLSQIESLVKLAKKHDKKIIVHTDLVQGLKSNEYGLEYLVNNIKVDGLISTRQNVITYANKHHLISIQRLFILDSQALANNLRTSQEVQPDFIEILPGVVPDLIKEIQEKTGLPVIAGGLIRTVDDVEKCLANGAYAVTTSKKELWQYSLDK